MWTPPHFWALALYRCRDYERVGVPMLPVVAGPAETRRQIWLYSLVLVVLALVPSFIGMAGVAYLIAAVGLGAMFLYLAWRVRKITEGREADAAARQPVRFLDPLSLPAVCRDARRAPGAAVAHLRSQRWRSS